MALGGVFGTRPVVKPAHLYGVKQKKICYITTFQLTQTYIFPQAEDLVPETEQSGNAEGLL